ncbi:hypothetical protein N9X05_18405, partial [Paracoccaceae bacterium]|nr:hypothetical protein [Paracoccaceae bacterium]
ISEPRAVTQKPSPSPAVRDVPPAIYRPSPKKPDRTSPIRARAPEVFKDGSRSAINFVLTAFIDN